MDGRERDQSPMELSTWTVGEACAWIAHRSPEAARPIWEANLYDDPFAAERDALTVQLIAGKIEASGIINGRRRTIDKHEWEDMSFTFELNERDGLIHRAHGTEGVFTDVRLSRDNILKVWPADQVKLTSADEKRAIQEARGILLAHNDITKPKLEKQLRDRGLNFSGNAFKNRIWPQARNEAHLAPGGRAGRRPASNRWP